MMGAFGSIEAEPAAVRMREAALRGTLSHALLLSGRAELTDAARYAAAALECTRTDLRPCGTCPACRKVLRQAHPDVTLVQAPARQVLSAEIVRGIRADAYIQPNEGERKVYIFPDSTRLTERDQNLLLKVVEEGPSYAAFVFCAVSAAGVLPTLRSRCVEYRFGPQGGGGRPAAGEAFCRAVAWRNGAVIELAVKLERARISREKLADLLLWVWEALGAALLLCYGRCPEARLASSAAHLAGSLDRRTLLEAMGILRKYYAVCAVPTGPGHVLGALAAELEELV